MSGSPCRISRTSTPRRAARRSSLAAADSRGRNRRWRSSPALRAPRIAARYWRSMSLRCWSLSRVTSMRLRPRPPPAAAPAGGLDAAPASAGARCGAACAAQQKRWIVLDHRAVASRPRSPAWPRAEVGQVVGGVVDAADEGHAPRRPRRSCGACGGARWRAAPRKRGRGSNTCSRTPAVGQRADERRRAGRTSRSRRPSRRPATPRRAAAISTRCSSRPTLSSNRMKVSSMTSCRAGDGLEHAREELLAVLEQRGRGCRCGPVACSSGWISAASGAWSDRCDQGLRGSTQRRVDARVAHVDAVQLQQRQARRKGLARRGRSACTNTSRRPAQSRRGCGARGGASR